MKVLHVTLFLLLLCCSCGVNQREKQMKEKESALNGKQKELLL